MITEKPSSYACQQSLLRTGHMNAISSFATTWINFAIEWNSTKPQSMTQQQILEQLSAD